MQSYDTKITPPQLLIHMSPITDHLAQSGSQLQPHVKSKHEAGYTVGYSKLSFPEEVRECRFSNSVVTKDKADGMGATTGGGEDKGMGESESFFGTSSTASFMRQIQQTVDKKNLISLSPTDHAVRTPVGGSGECPLKQHGDDLPENAEDFILPQRNVADHLVDCYWTWVHSLYPFLHRPTFLGMYNSLWANEDFTQNAQPDFKLPGRMFRCILNLVFAFGCQFSPSIAPSSRDLSSDVFFKRSRLLLHVDILGSGSIQLVQALLLMGQYLQVFH